MAGSSPCPVFPAGLTISTQSTTESGIEKPIEINEAWLKRNWLWIVIALLILLILSSGRRS
jgi:hypothetical protein